MLAASWSGNSVCLWTDPVRWAVRPSVLQKSLFNPASPTLRTLVSFSLGAPLGLSLGSPGGHSGRAYTRWLSEKTAVAAGAEAGLACVLGRPVLRWTDVCSFPGQRGAEDCTGGGRGSFSDESPVILAFSLKVAELIRGLIGVCN